MASARLVLQRCSGIAAAAVVSVVVSACVPGIAGRTGAPVPSGSTQDQAAAALRSVGLTVSASVSLTSTATAPARLPFDAGPSGVHYFPFIQVVVTNHGSAPVTFPFSFTFVRWDGTTWVHVPCLDDDSPGTTICSLASNQQTLAPGGSNPLTPGVVPEGSPPGTYAVICPSLREIADYPGYAAADGAAAIFTLTP
jgi:hypothetical protein